MDFSIFRLVCFVQSSEVLTGCISLCKGPRGSVSRVGEGMVGVGGWRGGRKGRGYITDY